MQIPNKNHFRNTGYMANIKEKVANKTKDKTIKILLDSKPNILNTFFISPNPTPYSLKVKG